MILRPVLLLVLSVITTIATAADIQLPAKKDFQIFILAGQSNMAGRGAIDEEGRTAKPRVYALNKESKWQPAVDPLHWDKPGAGVGIGKTFGEIIAAGDQSISVGLVPTACGGSPISTWMPGQHWAQTNSNPWDDCIARAKRAMQDGTLKAILWHQGESDATAKDAPLYEKRLEDLITRFRTELNAPDLPFIMGQLGRFPGKPWNEYTEMVHAAQQAVAKKMKNVRFVPIEGMTSKDNLHYDTASQRTFAKGYAEAYRQLAGSSAKVSQ